MNGKKMNLKLLSSLLLLWGLVTSCEKETIIREDNLTECASCEYLYRESARLDELRIVDGDAVVFQYKAYWQIEGMTNIGVNYSGLFIEIPRGRVSFSYGKNMVNSSKVVHLTMCPICNTVRLKPVDGYVKGKQVDGDRWLVEAKVVLADPTGKVVDTLTFKQYFMLEHDYIQVSLE